MSSWLTWRRRGLLWRLIARSSRARVKGAGGRAALRVLSVGVSVVMAPCGEPRLDPPHPPPSSGSAVEGEFGGGGVGVVPRWWGWERWGCRPCWALSRRWRGWSCWPRAGGWRGRLRAACGRPRTCLRRGGRTGALLGGRWRGGCGWWRRGGRRYGDRPLGWEGWLGGAEVGPGEDEEEEGQEGGGSGDVVPADAGVEGRRAVGVHACPRRWSGLSRPPATTGVGVCSLSLPPHACT